MKSFIVLGTLLSMSILSGACSSTPLLVGTDQPDGGGNGDAQADGASTSDAHGGNTTCTTDGDCGSSGICGFLESDACVAQGACFPAAQSTCEVYQAACACDGTTYNIACTGLPNGYVPKPFLHIDPCTDSGVGPIPDAGPSPTVCVTSSDCGGKRICGYPIADACVAKGTCFPEPGPTCGAFIPGCGCDGSLVLVGCNGLPDGYAPKPVVHNGQCNDAGK